MINQRINNRYKGAAESQKINNKYNEIEEQLKKLENKVNKIGNKIDFLQTNKKNLLKEEINNIGLDKYYNKQI